MDVTLFVLMTIALICGNYKGKANLPPPLHANLAKSVDNYAIANHPTLSDDKRTNEIRFTGEFKDYKAINFGYYDKCGFLHLILIFSGENYYLQDVGKKRCPSGSGLFDTTECKEACIELGIPLSGRKFKSGKSCYKGGSNVCNQNGGSGRRASLICKREGN